MFVDTVDALTKFSVESHFETIPELADRAYNRPRIEDLHTQAFAPQGSFKNAVKSRDHAYRLLRAHHQRLDQFDDALNHMQTQKNLMVFSSFGPIY